MKNYIELLVKNNEWCVKGINENLGIRLSSEYPKLYEKFIEKFTAAERIGFKADTYYSCNINNTGELFLNYTNSVPIGKTLISFQDFKRYVLEIDEEEPIKEDYSFLKEILTNLSIT